tara:strand:- start:2678 stop:2893 length:216 start_codon:yes stop_codon:yes gene_type:complete
MKKFRVKDLDGFENSVFGADDLLELFPALTTSGVSLVQQGSNYYVTDSKGNIVSDCTFFSEEEMQYMEEII